MGPNPKVSIIIPVYNAASALRRCLDSVLKQEFTDFELLLMDDGSSDESPAIRMNMPGRIPGSAWFTRTTPVCLTPEIRLWTWPEVPMSSF